MQRKRIWLENEFYHIVSRSIRREPLFQTFSDYQTFIHIMEKAYNKFQFELVSYCLMTNHYHLLLRSNSVSPSRVMAYINKCYANYFNKKYHFTGHVFEERFYSGHVKGFLGLIAVSHYIHLNPVRAKMIQDETQYRWSSCRYYAGKDLNFPEFFNVDTIFQTIPGDLEKKRFFYFSSLEKEKVRRYMKEEAEKRKK